MIISRTPLRISFFGGGTDYKEWYSNNGGSVINTSINKYNYVNVRFLPPFFKYKNCIRYFKREETNSVQAIKHASVRETLKFLKCDGGIEMVHNADLPARGGLGSSSSFTVGFLNAVWSLMGKIPTKKDLANTAIFIEQKKIKEFVGSQDQTAAAFGGLNRIDFGGRQNITVKPLTLQKDNMDKFQDHLMLFFLGFPRNASDIAKKQIASIPKNKNHLIEMQKIVDEAEKLLSANKIDFKEIGQLMNVQWMLKKKLSKNVSSNFIDKTYSDFIKNGAIGCKLCGAGGGGYMLVLANPNKHNHIKKKMKKFINIPFKFDFTGSQIVYYSSNDLPKREILFP